MKPHATNKHLVISGVLFFIVLILWLVSMIIVQPTRVNTVEKLKWIAENQSFYQLQFFFISLIAPALIYMMLAQLGKFSSGKNMNTYLGIIFLAGYVILVSIAYLSQVAFIPRLIKLEMWDTAAVWYFDSSYSVTYFIDQLGYCFWGVGAIVLFLRFVKLSGIAKYIGILYMLSAVFAIIAFIGLMIDNLMLNSMTLYSGLALIPIGILTIILGIKENKKET